MSISTFERNASISEMAVELDRRGKVIEKLEAEIEQLRAALLDNWKPTGTEDVLRQRADKIAAAMRALLPHPDLGDTDLFAYGPFAPERVATAADVRKARAALGDAP